MKEAWFCDGARGDLRGERHVRRWIAAAVIADVLLILIQLALCLTFDGMQVSDAESYLELARYCAEENTWYPGPRDMYATYIFGNGYVNLLSVVMRLSQNMLWAFLLNVLFTQMIVLSWADIAGQLTGRTQTACLTVVLLCTMCGLWGEAVATRTELCFMAFMGVSLALSLRKNAGALFAAGALMALANWVRPLLVVFLPGVLLLFLMRRIGWKRVLAYMAGLALVIVLVGTRAYQRTGRFVYQAQTMGVNMLMGANDDADGSYVGEIYEEGKPGYVEPGSGVTFDERDARYKRYAVEWIMEHPLRFAALAPAKLFYYLATDIYCGSSFFGNRIQTDNLDYIRELAAILTGRGERPFAPGDAVVILSQLTYMFVFIAYVVFVVVCLCRRCWLRLLPLHLIFALSCGVTVMTVGGARYHMPYLPIFCLCAATLIDCRGKKGMIAKQLG